MDSSQKSQKFILLALALPFLMMLMFMLVSAWPNYTIAPPKYSFIYTKEIYNQASDNVTARFKVINGKLIVDCKKNEANVNVNKELKLFIFEADKLAAREIFYQLPNRTALTTEWQTIVIDEVKNLQIDTSSKSPDAYKFATDEDSNGNFLFYTHRHNKNAINKGGKQIIIAGNYEVVQFLGWIVNK